MPDRDPRVALRSRACAVALAAGVVLAAGTTRPAEACGPTLPAAHPLSPPPAASNVPLNAVLIASSSDRTVRFALREMATGRIVPVSAACEGEGVVRLCQGRPGPLAPNTTYAWTAAPAPARGEEVKPGAVPSSPPDQIFTTGAETDERPALSSLTPDAAPLLAVDVLEHMRPSPSPCGIADIVRLRLTVARLDEPVVLAATGMNGGLPHGLEAAAPLLTPMASSSERLLYAAPACLAVYLVDVAGNVTHLPVWCPPPVAAAGVTAPGTVPETAACAAGPGEVPPVGTVTFAGALLSTMIVLARSGRRRRRR